MTLRSIFLGLLGVAVAALVLSPLYGNGRGYQRWSVKPRHVAWTGPDGQPAAGCVDPSLRRGDENLRSLVHQDRLWVVCRSAAERPATGLGAIDAVALRGRMQWPLPPDLPWERAEAVLPGPGGRLAFVYRVAGTPAAGALAAAVAGPDGRLQRPARIAPDGARVLGLAWVDDVLEVAYAPATYAGGVRREQVPAVVTPGGAARPVPLRDVCGDFPRCRALAGYRLAGERRWRFEVRGVVLETHEAAAVADPIDGGSTAAMAVDPLELNGVLRVGWWQHAQRLRPDGTRADLTEAERAWREATWMAGGKNYETRQGRLERRHVAAGRYGLKASARHDVGGRLIDVHIDPLTCRPTGGLVRVGDAGPGAAGPYDVDAPAVARMGEGTADLVLGAFFPLKGGGYRLVAPTGDYVTLDDNLRRTDAFSLLDYLRHLAGKPA